MIKKIQFNAICIVLQIVFNIFIKKLYDYLILIIN